MYLKVMPNTTVPCLETPRLRLRAHEVADFPACRAMWSDPIVTRFTIGKPSSEQRTWMRILTYLGHWHLLGYGYWAVEEKASGTYVGELGFADFKREVSPTITGFPELGWAFATHAHGKGYATEALLAATAWADRTLPDTRTVCIIQPENRASIRVAEKVGYKQYANAVMGDVKELLFERSRRP
jgi:RimJ/RimL family protein N-acetyltransferase